MRVLLSPRIFRLGRAFMVSWAVFFFLPIYVVLTGPFPLRARVSILLLVAGTVAVWTWFWTRVAGTGNRLTTAISVVFACVLLGIFTAMTPPQYGSLFVFAVVMAGAAFSWRVGVAAVIAITALATGIDILRGAPVTSVIGEVLNDLLVGLAGVAGRLLVSAYAQLAVARGEIARLAVDEERLRFARDLHDLLGHSLSVIAMKSELAGRLIRRAPGLAAHEVADIEEVARGALREVRDAVAGYRQPTLATEVAGARTALTAAGITVTCEHEAGPILPALEAVLAWTVREGATNVIRHSEASRCAIRVFRHGGNAVAEVVDDGRAGPTAPSGHGLKGLSERVAELGGRLEAGPLPHEGFRLRVTVPIKQVEETIATA